MAEEQQAHRHRLEAKVVQTESINSTLGIISGFIIGIATVVGGCIVAYAGKEWAGFALGSTGLAALVGVFVYGTRARKQEREDKFRMMQK